MPSTEGSSSRTSLILHGIGLIVIYSLYGVLQEKIMKSSTYGPEREHFTSSSLLIVVNRLFSIGVGLAILFYKTRTDVESGSFVQRLTPASPLSAYGAVAGFNFLSTSCQYQALRYVSYTTQSLAKTSKMIPVLVVGALIYRKKHLPREWAAGGVILAGCACYLFSTPPKPHGSHALSSTDEDKTMMDGLIGTAYLLGYLFFDGLVSTTQEKVFGKNPASSDPFGPKSPVLDQMLWTNLFAGLIAFAVSLTSIATGTFWNNVHLLLTDVNLLWDVCVFSAASAGGLIVLLNCIASFGALTSSLIMTIRQFLSILINAGIFGNFSSVSSIGWMGVFWVASGIWIKINRKYDQQPKSSTTIFDANGERDGMLEKENVAETTTKETSSESNRSRQYFAQYLVPVLIPIVLAIFISFFLDPTYTSSLGQFGTSHDNTSFDSFAPVPQVVEPTSLEVTEAFEVSIEPQNVEDDNDDDEEDEEENEETPTLSAKEEEEQVNSAEASEAAALSISVEGGRWDAELHSAMGPTCRADLTTVPYKAKIRTGFVSYPRSGNSYIRSLLERATGYQTSSIYCDRGLQRTFVGECNKQLDFFVKTHFPAIPRTIRPDMKALRNYFTKFDQVVLVTRNPLDAIASWWHLSHVPRTPEGYQNHEAKLDIGKFGEAQRADVLDLAERWRRHSVYWQQAPILTHTLRYEDLKAQPIPHMMSLVSYLLPDEELPPLADIACIAEHDEHLQAYHSRRSSDFATWDQYEEDLRMEVLKIVRRPFCSFGYQHVLRNAKGDVAEMQNFCDPVRLADTEYNEAAEVWM
ncbi:uncharacterized protein JCM6883_000792 [Sporobolomyces salmoneus]|uniref:uncharacterized protein n=1 Tax=Sporobolomyces salmoneus TaxID=183962 RepID=UPI0031756D09